MNAKELMEICAAELKKHDWHFTTKVESDDLCEIKSSVVSESGYVDSYKVWIGFRKWDLRAIYYFDLRVPKPRRTEVAEYLMRVNWRKLYGKFTLDFRDGEVCLMLMIPAAHIEHCVGSAMDDVFSMMVEMFDEALPGVFAVMTGAKTAEAAFEELVKRQDGAKPEPADSAPATSVPEASVPEASVPESPAPEAFSSEASGLPEPQDLFDFAAENLEGAEVAVPEEKPKKKRGAAKKAVKSSYSLEGLNLQGKIPLRKVVAAVRKFRSMKAEGKETPRLRILLSGMPGTGKTEFTKYLADKVGMPLRSVKVSDVVSSRVGDTEKAIAKMFAEAKKNGEMLFLDECDSFLRSRSDSDWSWEVTQVNELLQQLEEFDGVVVAATNFTDRLDKAVLRRFTYKLKLDYLTDEGKGIMFHKYFNSRLTKAESARLAAIANLTPGDFRTVRDELFYLSDNQTNAARLAALEAESEAKGRERAKIGFAA